MPSPIRLSEAIEEYERSRRAQGKAFNTIRGDRITLEALLGAIGNLQIRSIEAAHLDRLFANKDGEWSPATTNVHYSRLRTFFKWCRSRGYMRRDFDPLEDRKNLKVLPPERPRINYSKFDTLLNRAKHPRDRILVALGLFLFLRVSEIQTLKIKDVNLEDYEITVTVHKTKDRDVMPICEELDRELRAWLAYYSARCGGLDPDWYLVPAKSTGSFTQDPVTHRLMRVKEEANLRPLVPFGRASKVVRDLLVEIGLPRDTRLGVHVLRRSGARAMFDGIRDQDYYGSRERVQAMLHHSNGSMTEVYLGLVANRLQRNDQIRGKKLFPQLAKADNVVNLRNQVR